MPCTASHTYPTRDMAILQYKAADRCLHVAVQTVVRATPATRASQTCVTSTNESSVPGQLVAPFGIGSCFTRCWGRCSTAPQARSSVCSCSSKSR